MSWLIDHLLWVWLIAGAPERGPDASPPFGIGPESWAMGMGFLVLAVVFGMGLGLGVWAGAVGGRWFDIVTAGMLPPAIFLRLMALQQTFETCTLAAIGPSVIYVGVRWHTRCRHRRRRSAGR